nr:FHA domain-containing protein [Nitrosomonas nitrosa]
MAIYKIGRAEGNHVVLGDKSVSRNHAEIEELGAGRFRLKDLGSSSGTQMLSGSEWVDVQEAEVRHDTRIRFGEVETTPADLLRDTDKTVVQARPAASHEPPPVPAAPKPPQPAPPRPAAPKPAAPKPAAPAPRPAAAPGAQRPAGGGMDKKTMWIMIGGGGGLLLLAIIAVVFVLVTGDSQQRADAPAPPPRTEAPTPPRTEAPARPAPPAQPPAQPPAPPRTEAPRGSAAQQRFTQACTQQWGISAEGCQCLLRAAAPVLQDSDYDDAIDLLAVIFRTRNEEQIKQKMQQLVQQRGQETFQRIFGSLQAMDRDCKNVR